MYALWQVNYYDVKLDVGENGSADTQTLKVAFSGNLNFTITPNQGYYLESLVCNSGYIASGYITGLSATKAQSLNIKNEQVTTSGTCKISFKVACPYNVGHTWEFNFTGNSQDFVVPCSGDYRIEAYGASGGSHNPGNGGVLIGATTLNPPGTSYPGAPASGGTQIAGGTAIGAWRADGTSTGSFGVGANAAQCGAGAGGGWYGWGSEYTAKGSGGSSYVKNCTGCDTMYIPYQGDFVFRDIDIQQGKHIGNGKIKITLHSIKT